MKKFPIIRTIYLYLFSLVGLILIITGSIGFLNMGLKAWVFTEAEQEERVWRMEPPMHYGLEDSRAEAISNDQELTDEEREMVREWLVDYERWQETHDEYDPVIAERHRTAALSLAQLLVGIPLFLFHWLLIRKENKD